MSVETDEMQEIDQIQARHQLVRIEITEMHLRVIHEGMIQTKMQIDLNLLK